MRRGSGHETVHPRQSQTALTERSQRSRSDIEHGYQADRPSDDDSSGQETDSMIGYANQDSRTTNNRVTSTHRRQRGPKWSINDVLRSHKGRYVGIHPGQDFGMITREKNNDVVRIGYGNINGFPAVTINNPKVSALKKWMRKYDVDGFFGAEGNVNWKKMPTDGQLPEFFRSENALRTVAAYNSHENYGRKQQGGTFGLAFGQLASAVKNVGVDDTGLG